MKKINSDIRHHLNYYSFKIDNSLLSKINAKLWNVFYKKINVKLEINLNLIRQLKGHIR